MNTRRLYLGTLLSLMVFPAVLLFPSAVSARRGRVRMSGRGLAAGAKSSGPTLSRTQLQECVAQERRINSAMEKLDRDEASIEQQESTVNRYSQKSVDSFNASVNRFNANGAAANAQVDTFNTSCANRAYYESDMRAVETALGVK